MPSGRTEANYFICTAWYDDGENTPGSIGDMPMYPVGSTLKELKRDLKLLKLALKEPVLDWEDFSDGNKEED